MSGEVVNLPITHGFYRRDTGEFLEADQVSPEDAQKVRDRLWGELLELPDKEPCIQKALQDTQGASTMLIENAMSIQSGT